MYLPRRVLALFVGALFCGGSAVFGSSINPWDFNVVSLGNIGSPTAKYQSDFQGVAAVGGSAYFTLFSLHDVASAGPGTPYSLYAGGDVQITGSIFNGGIEAGGTVSMLGANVDGPIVAGGDLDGTGGTVNGDVTLAGQNLAGLVITIGGTLSEFAPFAPSLDLQELSDYFLQTSTYIGGLASNVGFTEQYGQIQVNVQSGVNVVELTAADLAAAWGFEVTGPADATLLINVLDTSATFDSINFDYTGGITPGHVLLNFPSADVLAISGGLNVNILAPQAETTFPQGLVTGNLIVGSLYGGGQVNAGGFDGTIPEPASMLLVLGGLALLPARIRRGGSSTKA